MAGFLEEICADVLKRVTPNTEERGRILKLSEDLRQKVREAADESGVEAEVRVEGSVAKDTWLSREPDIDIFMRVPITMPRKAFGTVCLEIAREATRGFTQTERFAEHPYLESIIDNVRVNIVPCYRVKLGEWISVTDRTPFHTDYIKPLLDKQLRGEVRLLKKFMKGIDVYGAEIRVGGFSGYLCELLALHYGSFTEVLRSTADWRGRPVIDYEGYFRGEENKAKKIFKEALIAVDPVDVGRNVAAAVRKKRLNELIVAARAFLKNPHLRFFYPEEIEVFDAENLERFLTIRGSTMVFIKFGRVKAVPDVLWGQLYKSQRSLKRMLLQHDFSIIRDCAWSNEKDLNVLIFEVEQRFLPSIRRHLGPPIEKRTECEKFMRKHLEAPHTISGPRIEGGRWIVETRRKHWDVVNLLNVMLRDGGRRVGVASLVSQAIANTLEVLVNKEVLRLSSVSLEFAKFLTEYLEGRPRWLRYSFS